MCWNLRPPLPAPVKARSAVMHAAIENPYFAHAVSHVLYVLGKTVVHESRKLLLLTSVFTFPWPAYTNTHLTRVSKKCGSK